MPSAHACHKGVGGMKSAAAILAVAAPKWTYTGAAFYKRNNTLEGFHEHATKCSGSR